MATLYSPIKIVFADDHEVLREGFHVMMNKQSDIKIIGEAKNGVQLVQLTKQLQPDIVVTDIQMPVMNGIEATVQITKEFPGIGVIAFSGFNEEGMVVDMLKAGAKGYILKSSEKEEVITAVKAVYKGHNYYCRETDMILSQLRIKNTYRNNPPPEFSEKELMIIKLICEELSNQEIGERLGLSKRTIEGYRDSIMEKMNVKNTAGVVLYAVQHKLYQFQNPLYK